MFSALHKITFAFKALEDLEKYDIFVLSAVDENSMVVSLTKTQRKDGAKSRPSKVKQI
jgi:hypothetical protein